MYSDKVMEHFNNPRNVGQIEDADTVGETGNPVCGDIIILYLKIEDDIIKDIKFKTFGCVAAIATSSMVTELVKGKYIDEALKISNKTVTENLGGLPARKIQCSNLAVDALYGAVKKYKKEKTNNDRSSS